MTCYQEEEVDKHVHLQGWHLLTGSEVLGVWNINVTVADQVEMSVVATVFDVAWMPNKTCPKSLECRILTAEVKSCI